MDSTVSEPYWRLLSPAVDPNSWIFFVVAEIAGRRRPLGAVSSMGADGYDPSETVQGYHLPLICQRLVTIFSDRSNHVLAEAEKSLASQFYVRDGCEHIVSPVELPEYSRKRGNPQRWDLRDNTQIYQFPFITTCLLQGVALPLQSKKCEVYRAWPEPLGTVYRDTSIEWGMVVIDITDLTAVSYGIVGFGVGEMRYISSPVVERTYLSAMGEFETGDLRVAEELRPRTALSAAEYLTKFDHVVPEAVQYNAVRIKLADTPVISPDAMELVWPSFSDGALHLIPHSPSIGHTQSLKNQALANLLKNTIEDDSIDASTLRDVDIIPGFKEALQHELVRLPSSKLYCANASIVRLFRFAFSERGHVNLTWLTRGSPSALSAALDTTEGLAVTTTLSLCLDRTTAAVTDFTQVLSNNSTLRKIYLHDSPIPSTDESRSKMLYLDLIHSSLFQHIDIAWVGSYAAALNERSWLSTTESPIDLEQQLLKAYPVHQMIVTTPEIPYRHISFGDSLIKAERFAHGFLTYLQAIAGSDNDWLVEDEAQLFFFSTAPTDIEMDASDGAEISPIPSETFSAWENSTRSKLRELSTYSWTAVVAISAHRSIHYGEPGHMPQARSLRYAFVRKTCSASRGALSPTSLPSAALEVVDLNTFLEIEAPTANQSTIPDRFRDMDRYMETRNFAGTLDLQIPRISVFTEEELHSVIGF